MSMTGFTQIAFIYCLARSRVSSSGIIYADSRFHLTISILDASAEELQSKPPSKNNQEDDSAADEEALRAEITRFLLQDTVKPHRRNMQPSASKSDESQNDDGASSSTSSKDANKQSIQRVFYIAFDISASFSSVKGFTPVTVM